MVVSSNSANVVVKCDSMEFALRIFFSRDQDDFSFPASFLDFYSLMVDKLGYRSGNKEKSNKEICC